MPAPASRLYAQNLLNVIMLMTRGGRFVPDLDDEIVSAMCVTHDGQVFSGSQTGGTSEQRAESN
jgi:NAD(P) transhydrogenase subunit alpha